MKFIIKEVNGFIPDLVLGQRGQELNCFIPDQYIWQQVGYGQGEGQVLIDGCEWGFYYSDCGGFSLILHEGKLDLKVACDFVSQVTEKIYGAKAVSVETSLVGVPD